MGISEATQDTLGRDGAQGADPKPLFHRVLLGRKDMFSFLASWPSQPFSEVLSTHAL